MALLIACTHYITITAKDSTCSHPCPMLSFNIVTKEAENICNIPTGKESTDEKNTIRTAYGLPACVHAGCGRYTDKGRSSKYKRKFRAEDHATSEKISNGKYWNHSGSFVNNPDGWTDTPCTHHGNCLAKGYQGQCGCNSFSNAISVWDFQKNSVMMCSEVHQEPGLAIRTCQKVKSRGCDPVTGIIRIPFL